MAASVVGHFKREFFMTVIALKHISPYPPGSKSSASEGSKEGPGVIESFDDHGAVLQQLNQAEAMVETQIGAKMASGTPPETGSKGQVVDPTPNDGDSAEAEVSDHARATFLIGPVQCVLFFGALATGGFAIVGAIQGSAAVGASFGAVALTLTAASVATILLKVRPE